MCGEQMTNRTLTSQRLGSPPRVRGTGSRRATVAGCGRITPACAGNSSRSGCWWHKAQDHPRVCGEQFHGIRPRNAHTGSPPRVRGTEKMANTILTPDRITPACAGNSFTKNICYFISWDHPRVCGEQHRTTKGPAWPGGSPPRVRGTGAGTAGQNAGDRITPACAGNRARRAA